MNKNIAAIINGYDTILYNEEVKEDISELSVSILQKKLKKMNEQVIYFHAENRLLYNYLIWYEKRILPNQDQEKRNSVRIPLSNKPDQNNIPFISKPNLQCLDEAKTLPRQISKSKIKQPLSIQKKREIAEASFKVLLAYSQRYGIHTTHCVDECINTIESDEETISHLELELMILKKFMRQINQNFHDTHKRLTAEEVYEFFRDRIRYREALDERKRQKTVRLHFNLEGIEKSIRKIHQIVDTVTEVDYEQLQIDIEKQSKELNIKNKMLIFYKRQQSEANMKFNAKKRELFKEIHTLASIRNETNNKIQQLNRYDEVQQKMQDEITEYEKLNEPLREMTVSYRVPSIINYVDLKSKQINLHRQKHAWERKVQIATHALHLRQIEASHNPEKIIHPWKYLQNPSPILFYQPDQTNEINPTVVKSKLNNKLTLSIGIS